MADFDQAGPSQQGNHPRQAQAAGVPRDVSFFADGEATWMSSAEAHASLEHVIAASVHAAGFDGIERSALSHMRVHVESAMQGLLFHTAELAAVGRRRKPSLRDLFMALVYAGPRLHPAELLAHLGATTDDERDVKSAIRELMPVVKRKRDEVPQWARWCDDWLASDDEEEKIATADGESSREATEKAGQKRSKSITWGEKRRKLPPPSTMDEIPAHLPALPPSHTWKTSPAFPTKSVDSKDPIAFINAKVSSTRLTEASLRSLIRATDSAAFDGRLRRTHKALKSDDREDTEMAGVAPSADVSQASATAKPSPSAGEAAERPQRKGRGLSLKLRTSMTASPGVEGTSNAADADAGKGPQTAAPRSGRVLTLPSRRSSVQSAGGLAGAAGANAGSFPFGAPPSRRGSNATPGGVNSVAMTPLTPGAGFVYPQTPADFYGQGAGASPQGIDGMGDPATAGLDRTSGGINIPGVVNYKRTWYKRNMRPASSSPSAA